MDKYKRLEGVSGYTWPPYILGHFAYTPLLVCVFPCPQDVYSQNAKLKGFAVIPANEKVFQISWRSRAYTGDKFGKS